MKIKIMIALVEHANFNMQDFKLIIINSYIHFKKNNSNAQIFSKNFIENRKPSLKNLNEIEEFLNSKGYSKYYYHEFHSTWGDTLYIKN